MIELQVKSYAALCQLRWLVMSLPAAEFEIVVVFGEDWSLISGWKLIVRGTIFRSSAVPNNEQSSWVFHVLGESCTTIVYQIWSGVFFFNDYNLRSFCKHLRSMQHFFSNSRILFCCFKRSRAFLSSLFFSVVFFCLFLVAQSNFDDLKGLESVLELAIFC